MRAVALSIYVEDLQLSWGLTFLVQGENNETHKIVILLNMLLRLEYAEDWLRTNPGYDGIPI